MIDKKFEVHFTAHHVTHLPWTTHYSMGTTVLETSELCHVTHDLATTKIQQENHFVFKPSRKTLRNYGSHGGSDKCTTYIIDNPAESLHPTQNTYYSSEDSKGFFPGTYIWWSPSNESPNHPSYFGNRKFTINLTKLLQCYQSVIKKGEGPLPNIHFRCGGTLRYDKQVCKVIIICPVDCPELSEDSFPPFDFGGIGFGDLTQREIKPKLRYDILPTCTQYCGEVRKVLHRVTYAFAMYFPDKSYELKCPNDIVQCSEVAHGFCVGKEKDSFGCYLCPNFIRDFDHISNNRSNDDRNSSLKRRQSEIEFESDLSYPYHHNYKRPRYNNDYRYGIYENNNYYFHNCSFYNCTSNYRRVYWSDSRNGKRNKRRETL